MATMRDDQTAQLSVSFVDKLGKPAAVQGAPVWEVLDQSKGALVVAEDGMSAVFTPADLGDVQVQCTADADHGEGVKPIILTGDLTIVGGEAVAGQMNISITQSG